MAERSRRPSWFGPPRSVAAPVVAVSVGLLAAVLAILGILRAAALRQALYATTAQNLASTYRTLLLELSPAWITPLGLVTSGSQLTFALSSPTVGVLAVDAAGEVVAASPTRRTGRWPPRFSTAFYRRALVQPLRGYLVVGGARGQLVILERLVGPMGPVGLVELATPLTPLQSILSAEERFDLVGGAVAVALAAWAAWVMIRRQLMPLEAITTASERVAGGDLSQRVNLSPRRDEIGRLARAFDEMVARLSVSFARERAAQDQLRNFLADASHALRTPLTVLTGHLDLLLTGDEGEPAQRHAVYRRLRAETERLSRLVSGLLALSRLEAAPAGPRQTVALGDWLQALRPDLEAMAGDRLRLVAGPALALADPLPLREVVLSLVENAVRYGGGEAVIRVESGLRPGPFLEVADSGPGLAEDERERVFERFVRGRAAHGKPGAGLGLDLARRMVLAMGGRIEAGRAPEGGARFTVWLEAPDGGPLRIPPGAEGDAEATVR